MLRTLTILRLVHLAMFLEYFTRITSKLLRNQSGNIRRREMATPRCQICFLTGIHTTEIDMEKSLDKILEDIVITDYVKGCLVSDKQGLCLGMKGNVSSDSSGILTAIAEQARHLSPSSKEYPVVILETNDKQCILQSNDKLVLSIIKSLA